MQKKIPTEKLFELGAHYGMTRRHRHPSTKKYICGIKNNIEIFALDQTVLLIEKALTFMYNLGQSRKSVLFVSGHAEISKFIVDSANTIQMPYVGSRWIGGSITNFDEIKKRISRMTKLSKEKEEDQWKEKYTKREQVLLNRELTKLQETFGGLERMKDLPSAIVIVDIKNEPILVEEAKRMNIPIVALANSDCDINDIACPIVLNNKASTTVAYILELLVDAYKEGTQASSRDTNKDK